MLVVVGVASVVVLSGLVGELLGGSGLGAGVEVLDLGLAEDARQVVSAPAHHPAGSPEGETYM